jgi:GDP-L-fucose synthase
MFERARVLVTGGAGLIGSPLVELLLERGARVRVAALDPPSLAPEGVEYHRLDLTEMSPCLRLCDGMDYVFHLAGIKGSPAMSARRPASFFVPTLAMNTNVLEAARRCGVRRVLYTSTIGVYGPAELFREDDVWKTFPSERDRFAGWAKRMGELQAEAYRIEYGWDRFTIVRPANVYGPRDNFDPRSAMVIPSLIERALSGEDPLVVWGDGSAVRDFIHADDVARGMILMMEREAAGPINLGSGVGVSIRRLVELIVAGVSPAPRVVWDPSQPVGDRVRLMDVGRARALGFEARISLEEGIRRTMEWYRPRRRQSPVRYNAFTASGGA